MGATPDHMAPSPSLEIHLEAPEHAVSDPTTWPVYLTPEFSLTLKELEERLKKHHVSVTWYMLGFIAHLYPEIPERLLKAGHHLGSHGYFHRHGEREGGISDLRARRYLPECVGYRSPFWDTTPRPGLAGGFFFRTLPYPVLKREIKRQGVLYLHPHDFYDSHLGPWTRRMFLCNPWTRLERLLTELPFDGTR